MRSFTLAAEFQSCPPPHSSKDVFNVVPQAIVAFVKGFDCFLVALLCYAVGVSTCFDSAAKFAATESLVAHISPIATG